MRILVTGSRTWDDFETIADAMRSAWLDLGASYPWTLVSGACPDGADAIAEEIGGMFDATIERHPAKWDRYGKRAGFVRNAFMVSLGADVCLAFIRDESKGATMTARLAQEAGIPTRIYRSESTP